MNIYGIKFQSSSKIYDFKHDNELKKGIKVIVDTDHGEQLAEIVTEKKNSKISISEIKEIKRIATDEDYDKFLKNLSEAEDVLVTTKELVEKNKLDMTLVNASYSLDKKFLIINFISDDRIDFRDLVKQMASIFHTRIELHQVGVRDKAKIIGGIGLCGRELCCHGCLSSFNSVNINMAKTQNIALNPNKINGACGRLLCCFDFENETYEANRKLLPRMGEKKVIDGKKGEVISLNILDLKYTLKYEDGMTQEFEYDREK